VVILTVTEMKRLARNAAELMTLAATLQHAGIQLELLTGASLYRALADTDTNLTDRQANPDAIIQTRHQVTKEESEPCTQ
jgi:DNA invertase Pin-like site-specific DNA recombinase